MKMASKKTVVLMVCLASVVLLSGCTNWKKKYEALEVEHQNLRGLLDRERSEKGQLAGKINQDQQTIEQLQKQIGRRRGSAGEVTGFGKGYNVSVDAAAGTITVTLPNTILFSSGRVSLKKATIRELDHISSVLKNKYSGRAIDVLGHTDSDPIKKSKWKDNWQLSSERALTVLRYLVKGGVPEKAIRSVGCGAARPVASNKSSAGKAKNRRVEIVVHMR